MYNDFLWIETSPPYSGSRLTKISMLACRPEMQLIETGRAFSLESPHRERRRRPVSPSKSPSGMVLSTAHLCAVTPRLLSEPQKMRPFTQYHPPTHPHTVAHPSPISHSCNPVPQNTWPHFHQEMQPTLSITKTDLTEANWRLTCGDREPLPSGKLNRLQQAGHCWGDLWDTAQLEKPPRQRP